MWIVFKFLKWENIGTNLGIPLAKVQSDPKGCIGFIPIFEDLNDAINYAGDDKTLVKEIIVKSDEH